MTARTVSARDLEKMLPDATEVELPGPEGGWATATINGHFYRARVAAAAVAERPSHICQPCWEGDHRNHKPHLAGICIGCTCEETP